MNIMVITTLYPTHKEQQRNEITHALHYFFDDWAKQGHKVQVVRIQPTYPSVFNVLKKSKMANAFKTVSSFKKDNVNVTRVPITKIPKINYGEASINKSYKIIKNYLDEIDKPDVILCHMINPSLYIAELVKKYIDVPLVVTLHQTDLLYLDSKKKHRSRYDKVLRNIDQLCFRSESIRETYNKIGFIVDQTSIVSSGIDEDAIIDLNKLKNKKNRKSKEVFIAASLIKLKNIDVLLRSFSKLNDKDIVLKIAGSGPEKNKLLKLVRQLGIEHKVSFLGFLSRKEVLKYMEESDVFVMVSSPETFGLVYLEAMAKGCITIGAKGEGIDGTIVDGENGYLCSPRNVNELKLKLAQSIHNTNKDKMLTNAVSTAKKMTQNQISEDYLRTLKRIKR
ncbi:glycosyltransferase involved in cell wall biosynthesis [Alkalibacillus filiformis]|uniref:Glycosyltransferase involved in cell wall biosynthesis n=1 Tax=Alkalibacillus filiformis TaxID=200990 RepID=A0ABU0DWL3_9BACI|nr:glycosyltransferase family 4 protein [Alkalibacillus filiformis]MDQ0352760.1 glycosyltransferase involved in cell wall biosynthesis [Alkalibacillus filiformis]